MRTECADYNGEDKKKKKIQRKIVLKFFTHFLEANYYLKFLKALFEKVGSPPSNGLAEVMLSVVSVFLSIHSGDPCTEPQPLYRPQPHSVQEPLPIGHFQTCSTSTLLYRTPFGHVETLFTMKHELWESGHLAFY